MLKSGQIDGFDIYGAPLLPHTMVHYGREKTAQPKLQLDSEISTIHHEILWKSLLQIRHTDTYIIQFCL